MIAQPEPRKLKFRLAYLPFDPDAGPGERLWGHWLDEDEGLVVSRNNAFEVPLAVDDVVRVAPDDGGTLQVVELVRLAESVVTWTSFAPPVTTEQALAVYDCWVRDGHSVHTEGGLGIMATAWTAFTPLEGVLRVLGPTFVQPGWTLWQAFTPGERYAYMSERVDLAVRRRR